MSPASRDGRHNGNTITVFHRGGFLLEIANVLIVQVDVDEGAQLPVVGIKMTAQVGMLGDEIGKGGANGTSLNLNRRLLASILAQGSGDLDLGHRLYMMPQEGREIQPVWGGYS
jgi:hypothetical protein